MANKNKKSIIIPKGTEQETWQTRGLTEKPKPEKRKQNIPEKKSRIIPAGTQQETGLTGRSALPLKDADKKNKK